METASANSTPARLRRAVKAQEVASQIRRQIVTGRWSPGFQLPPWNDLESRYEVARSTLTEAMRQLKRGGFVYSASTRGTFVAPHPPHLSRYALAFRGEPGAPGWVRFWWALANQATERYRDGAVQLVPFYGVAGSDRTSGHERLVQQVRDDRLAGVIFVGHPPEISDELLHHPWLAKVVIGGAADSPIARVYPDRWSFIERSLAHLAAAGRHRLAVITSGLPDFAVYDQLAPTHGLDLPPHFRVGAAVADPSSANHIVRLLLDRPDEQRPDALVITDDNLTESALAGVLASGLRMPDELTVLSHCNWPVSSPSAVPVARLGFDARDVLDRAVRRVHALRHGEPVEHEHVPVPAVFEHELADLGAPLSAHAASGF